MNSYPPNTPLQPLQGGNTHYPNTGQSSSVVQYDTTTVREMPKDYIIWSLCCFLYSNPFCLGLAALIHSIKARDRKVMGDIEGARAYGKTARTLNIIATAILCFSVLIFIIVFSVLMSQLHSYSYNYYHYNRYPYSG